MKTVRILKLFLAVFLVPVLFSCEKEDPSVNFDVTTIDMEPGGGYHTVSLRTNYDWTATTSDLWLEVFPTSGKKGTVTLTIKAVANDKGRSRRGRLNISCRELTRAVNVIQPPVLPQSLIVKHGNGSYTAPYLTGSSVTGIVKWGDGAEETYIGGLKHTYSSAGNHTLEINAAGANSFKVPSLVGVTEIDFLDF